MAAIWRNLIGIGGSCGDCYLIRTAPRTECELHLFLFSLFDYRLWIWWILSVSNGWVHEDGDHFLSGFKCDGLLFFSIKLLWLYHIYMGLHVLTDSSVHLAYLEGIWNTKCRFRLQVFCVSSTLPSSLPLACLLNSLTEKHTFLSIIM